MIEMPFTKACILVSEQNPSFLFTHLKTQVYMHKEVRFIYMKDLDLKHLVVFQI